MKLQAQKQAEDNATLGLDKSGNPAAQADVEMTDREIANYDKGMRDILTSVVVVGANSES